jgi:hypothetical protein
MDWVLDTFLMELLEEVMYLTRLLLVFVVTVAVAACAVQQHPLTATAAANLRGRRVATTVRPSTPFFVTEPGQDMANMLRLGGALAVAASMSDAGARIFRENGVADPAPFLAQQLSDDLHRRYGLRLERQSLYITDEDPKQITAAHPEVDLLLDVWINSLSLEPFSQDSSKCHVKYTARLRLIDAKIIHPIDGKKGLVIAHGTCVHIPEETPSAPTYDEFLASGAQRLKHELDLATQSCVEVFRSKVLTAEATP